jgi:hypothetical protein
VSDRIQEAAEVIERQFGLRLVARDVAQALADAGLLPVESEQEYGYRYRDGCRTGEMDVMGSRERVVSERDDAIAAFDEPAEIVGPLMVRTTYATAWREVVPDGE